MLTSNQRKLELVGVLKSANHVFFSRYEKLPVSEIANRMGRTPSAIRHLLLRAMEKLRESFGEETESFHLPARGLEEGRKDAES